MDVTLLVQTVAIYALPVLFAITLHEAAHGYVARHFGDMTAHAQGRISLNPLRHIDPIGTVVVPLGILLVSMGNFMFGWAKPVPVNYSALRNPRTDMALVAAAGPAANLLMTIAWAIALRVAILLSGRQEAWLGVAEEHGIFRLADAAIQHANSPVEFLIGVCAAGILVNLLLMLLNLLPIPPLDGGRIVTSLLPTRAAWRFGRLEPWGIPLLLALVFIPVYGSNALSLILSPLLVESGALIRAIVL